MSMSCCLAISVFDRIFLESLPSCKSHRQCTNKRAIVNNKRDRPRDHGMRHIGAEVIVLMAAAFLYFILNDDFIIPLSFICSFLAALCHTWGFSAA